VERIHFPPLGLLRAFFLEKKKKNKRENSILEFTGRLHIHENVSIKMHRCGDLSSGEGE
jgi:hypothetical protein